MLLLEKKDFGAGEKMIQDKVTKYHLVFFIVTIIAIFLVEHLVKEAIGSKLTLIGMVVFIIMLIILTNALIFAVYGFAILYILGFNHKMENPITQKDILLTTPAIVTTLVITYIFNAISSINSEYNFLLTIIIIPFVYLGIYEINGWIFPKMFH